MDKNLPALRKITSLVKVLGDLEKQLILVISKEKDPILKTILEQIRHLGIRIAGFFEGIKKILKKSSKNKKNAFVNRFFIKYFSVISQNTYISHKIIEYVLNDLEWLNQHSDRIISCLKSLYADLFTLQVDCEELYKQIFRSTLKLDFGFRIKMETEHEGLITLKNSFNILNVNSSCSIEDVKSAFRILVKKLHPDLNPDADREEFLIVEKAYERLRSYFKDHVQEN
jgi:hypothetical protein